LRSSNERVDKTPQIGAFAKLKLTNCAPISGLRNTARALMTRARAQSGYNRGYLFFSLLFTTAVVKFAAKADVNALFNALHPFADCMAP
jgi:hypothetical protein